MHRGMDCSIRKRVKGLALAASLTIFLWTAPLVAQQPADPTTPAQDNSRILGVLPNYLTAQDGQPYTPLAGKEKLKLSLRQSVDWAMLIFNGGVAAIYQAERQEPSFGYGVSGYAKRYAAATADETISKVFSNGILPAVLHEDPRYFRKAEG